MLLIFLVTRAPLPADGTAPGLRGRGLEIVDDSGKVRASIKVLPANPNVTLPDGSTGYPEKVLRRKPLILRLKHSQRTLEPLSQAGRAIVVAHVIERLGHCGFLSGQLVLAISDRRP